MRKYSRVKNPELLAKYNIPTFRVTINNRAHREIQPDGTVIVYDCRPNDKPYFENFSTHINLKAFPEEIFIDKREDGIEFMLPILRLWHTNGVDLFVTIENCSCLTIIKHNNSILAKRRSFNGRICKVEDEELTDGILKQLQKNFNDLSGGVFNENQINSLIYSLQLFSKKASSSSDGEYNERLSTSMLLADTNFMKTHEFENYTDFIFHHRNYNFKATVAKMLSSGIAFDTIEDYLRFMNIPTCFAPVYRNEHFKTFMDSTRYYNPNIEGLNQFPVFVQTLLSAYAMSGDVTIEDIIDFTKDAKPEWFNDNAVFNALKKFMARDLKLGNLEDFTDMVEKLKKYNIPITAKTVNSRFMSAISKRNYAKTYCNIGSSAMDGFETLLESDANKAFEFLMQKGYN